MRSGQPSQTARRAAAYRAVHQMLEGGVIFQDPLASRILDAVCHPPVLMTGILTAALTARAPSRPTPSIGRPRFMRSQIKRKIQRNAGRPHELPRVRAGLREIGHKLLIPRNRSNGELSDASSQLGSGRGNVLNLLPSPVDGVEGIALT